MSAAQDINEATPEGASTPVSLFSKMALGHLEVSSVEELTGRLRAMAVYRVCFAYNCLAVQDLCDEPMPEAGHAGSKKAPEFLSYSYYSYEPEPSVTVIVSA